MPDGENVLEVGEDPADWRHADADTTVLPAEGQTKPIVPTYLASSSSSVLCMASVSYFVLHCATSAFPLERARCSSALASCSSSYCSRKRSQSCLAACRAWARAFLDCRNRKVKALDGYLLKNPNKHTLEIQMETEICFFFASGLDSPDQVKSRNTWGHPYWWHAGQTIKTEDTSGETDKCLRCKI